MESLDVLRTELKAIGAKVDTADGKIFVALEAKNAAYLGHEKAKTAVRKLKAVRDPLRIEQMQLQSVIGNLDPDTPPSVTISNGSE